jgi:hypothetical protein
MNSKVAPDRPWADTVGYSRAVRFGNLIEVSGTSATRPDGSVVASGDAYLLRPAKSAPCRWIQNASRGGPRGTVDSRYGLARRS